MKVTVATAVLLLVFTIAVAAQDIDPEDVNTLKDQIIETLQTNLEADFNTLLSGVGYELTPKLQQSALSANIVGDAELGNFPHYTFSVIGLGLNVYDGIGEFLTSDQTEWQSEIINFGELIDEQTEDTPGFGVATERLIGLPSFRIGFGIGLIDGYEIFGSTFFVPFSVLELVKDMSADPDDTTLNNLELQTANISLRLRKTIVGRPGQLGRSLSVGAGYTYSGFAMGYTLGSLFDISDEAFVAEEDFNLYAEVYDTTFSVGTDVHTYGLDIHMSRRWPVVTTFFKVSPYVYHSRYYAKTKLNGVLIESEEAPTEDTIAELRENADTDFSLRINSEHRETDLSVHLSAGTEFRVLGFVFHTSLGYNLEDPLFNVGNVGNGDRSDGLGGWLSSEYESFSGVINGLTGNIGLRLQY